ncbi:MAG: ABC transporter permease [Chromatiales bacterium]|nr:MAG: ABC transporter permease [Chromatiales bacterium]
MSAAAITANDAGAGTVQVALSGDWLLGHGLPGPDPVLDRLRKAPKPSSVAFDTGSLGDWDTGLVTALVAIHRSAEANGVQVDDAGLPEGARRLVALAFAVKEREGARRTDERTPFLQRIGESTLDAWNAGKELLAFVGEMILSARRFFTGKATYLRSDILLHIEEAGADALPIVTLISFLIGMIFAFVGVMQLNMFGAGIFTANLVALAMVREMSAIMTGIIMAGRTGAAYAAQIGTMKVNEEVDALSTLGINPMDFLVTPRVIALILMMPLLSLYSSLMGILGGMLVGLIMLDVSLQQYVQQTISAVGLNSLFGGLFKSLVYGILVALAGCQQGIACGSSAMAVGQATTQAVVRGIVLIVVSASVLTVIYINLGI